MGRALSEQEKTLRLQHDQAMADLQAQLTASQSDGSAELESALGKQHEQAMSELAGQMEQAKSHALSEQEKNLAAAA